MTSVNDIERALFEWAPLSFAMKDDKVGLQAGERHKTVRRVLVSLDVTQAVISEAVFSRADLIVSHHGILFGEFRPTDDTGAGGILLTLCQTGLASIAMHTNLDAAKGGINDALARLLGVTGIRVFDEKYGIGRIGRIAAPLPVHDYAAQCKAALKTGVVRFHDAGRPVETVALGPGASGFILEDAILAGCDTFVAGDIKHHEFLIAQNSGINLLDCGHFATEKIIVPVLADYLREKFPNLSVEISKASKEPYQCL